MAETQTSNREPGAGETQTTQASTTETQTTATTGQQTTQATAIVTAGQEATQAPGKVPGWPDDWRQQFAGDEDKDGKALKRLERFTDPRAVFKSFRELESKVSSGQLKAPTAFPADGTDAEKAEWRAQNNVPAAPADYLKAMSLPADIQVPEQDRPLVDKFLANMHEKNANPEVASAALATYYQIKAENETARLQLDATQKAEVEETLRGEWIGPDYRQNFNYVNNFIANFPQELQAKMKNARLPDGTALLNSAEFIRGAARLQRELNPSITPLPNGANGPAAIDTRIAEIEGVMRKDRGTYNANSAMQAEYRDLIDARERNKQRAA